VVVVVAVVVLVEVVVVAASTALASLPVEWWGFGIVDGGRGERRLAQRNR